MKAEARMSKSLEVVQGGPPEPARGKDLSTCRYRQEEALQEGEAERTQHRALRLPCEHSFLKQASTGKVSVGTVFGFCHTPLTILKMLCFLFLQQLGHYELHKNYLFKLPRGHSISDPSQAFLSEGPMWLDAPRSWQHLTLIPSTRAEPQAAASRNISTVASCPPTWKVSTRQKAYFLTEDFISTLGRQYGWLYQLAQTAWKGVLRNKNLITVDSGTPSILVVSPTSCH